MSWALAHLSMSAEKKDVGKQIMNLRDNEIPKSKTKPLCHLYL